MSDMTYEILRKRISENLNAGIREFGKTIGDISRNFKSLGLETSVWCPEKIHSTNLGGIVADSYIGYSRIEGKWGLIIRTIERDSESLAFVSQRVYAIESCRNLEIVAHALKRVRDLLLLMAITTDRQVEILNTLGNETDSLRYPECKF
jgi:hypothetical protein